MNHTLHQLQHEIASALDGLDATQTQLRPAAPNKWTIQQIIEHLLLTYSGAEMALNARLAKGRPTIAKPTAFQRIQQIAVCDFGYFPRGRTAPPMVTPEPTAHPLSGDELTAATEENLKQITGRQLTPGQQDIVTQIKEFMDQSKSAIAAGDSERGHNLAEKAHLLSEDLLKP